MIQFFVVELVAFLGMYLLVKELTDSSIIALLCGGMFMFLPFQPVYGLSVVGGPLAVWAFLCLYQGKRIIQSFLSIILFGLGANLILLGYVILGLVLLVLIGLTIRWHKRDKYQVPEIAKDVRRHNQLLLYGFLTLLVVYVITNFSLFLELFVGSDYVSHREEMVITGTGFGSAWEVFLHSAQHAPTLHEKLIMPIILVIIFYAIVYKKLPKESKTLYWYLVSLFAINVLVALFYGFCQSPLVVDFRNSVTGFLHYFSAYRVYWIYPTTWYVMAGLSAGLVWKHHGKLPAVLTGILIVLVLVPTAWNIRQNSNWILNKSQYKNNGNVGLISWKDYFAEDVMSQIEADIVARTGAQQDSYKVASLGMCPATALQSGFHCIDGYSNNYSLDYKHAFREIIETELIKCDSMKNYFDVWGSRCYLFTEESQNYYYLKKDADFQYQNLELNTQKMKELGCKFLFSGAEIAQENVQKLGMDLFGIYDTEESYYRVWVYEVK